MSKPAIRVDIDGTPLYFKTRADAEGHLTGQGYKIVENKMVERAYIVYAVNNSRALLRAGWFDVDDDINLFGENE